MPASQWQRGKTPIVFFVFFDFLSFCCFPILSFDIPFFDLDCVLADTGSVAIRRFLVLLRVCVDTASESTR